MVRITIRRSKLFFPQRVTVTHGENLFGSRSRHRKGFLFFAFGLWHAAIQQLNRYSFVARHSPVFSGFFKPAYFLLQSRTFAVNFTLFRFRTIICCVHPCLNEFHRSAIASSFEYSSNEYSPLTLSLSTNE